jgi:hypothetical protein
MPVADGGTRKITVDSANVFSTWESAAGLFDRCSHRSARPVILESTRKRLALSSNLPS